MVAETASWCHIGNNVEANSAKITTAIAFSAFLRLKTNLLKAVFRGVSFGIGCFLFGVATIFGICLPDNARTNFGSHLSVPIFSANLLYRDNNEYENGNDC